MATPSRRRTSSGWPTRAGTGQLRRQPQQGRLPGAWWGTRTVARESLHDLFFNPGEGRNVVNNPEYAHVAADLRTRPKRWMEVTSDPLLDGPVPAPPGAQINAQDQLSAAEPTFTVDGTMVGAATDASA